MPSVSLRRLNNFDHDHFPIFISLQDEESANFEQKEMKPDNEDQTIAAEKIAAV